MEPFRYALVDYTTTEYAYTFWINCIQIGRKIDSHLLIFFFSQSKSIPEKERKKNHLWSIDMCPICYSPCPPCDLHFHIFLSNKSLGLILVYFKMIRFDIAPAHIDRYTDNFQFFFSFFWEVINYYSLFIFYSNRT